MLSSGSISDIMRKVKYSREVNRYDKELMASIDSTRKTTEKHRAILDSEQNELLVLKADKEEETIQMMKEKDKQKDMLSEIKNEKKAYLSTIKELERAQRELNLLVKKLEEKRMKTKSVSKIIVEKEKIQKTGFEKEKGRLQWPVIGKVIREYGKIIHPLYKTVTMSNGIDIQVAKGKIVSSVASGLVEYVGWMRGYGKFVIINHMGGYLTIYAHLDEIYVVENEQIKAGAAIGITGETGSLTGPMLHFQIRRSSETLNPREWLEKR